MNPFKPLERIRTKTFKLVAHAVLLGVCFFFLNGCALTKDYVSISYQPQPNASKIEGAEKVSVMVEVSDLREVKDNVGAKKNGYGMEMAPIISTNDVAVTLQKAIETELTNRGFHLSSDDMTVLVELNKFRNDFKTGFWAGDAVSELTMNVLVKKADGSIAFSKLISGQGIEPNIQLATGNNAQIALRKAMQDAVGKLFSEPAFTAHLIKAAKP